MTKKYEEYKIIIQKLYNNYETKLKDIVNKIISNKNDNEKYYKEFKDEINNFSSNIYEKAKNCLQEILKCHKEEIEKYSLSEIYKDEDINFLSLKEIFLNKASLFRSIGGLGIGMIVYGGFFLLGECSLLSFGIGCLFGGSLGIIGLPLGILLIFFLDNKARKEKIQKQFETYFKKISSYKERILNKLEEIYKIAFYDLKKYKISQIKPMKNIYDNKTKFESIIEQNKNIYIEIEKN